MREFRTSGSVRGAASNGRPYRELISRAGATGNSRATLTLVTSSEGREVGALSRHSSYASSDGRAAVQWARCYLGREPCASRPVLLVMIGDGGKRKWRVGGLFSR